MQKVVCEKHFDEFIRFDYLYDGLDVFLRKYFSEKEDLWRVCKSVSVLSHGQSFFVNKEVVDTK